jgi:hypothetical protein
LTDDQVLVGPRVGITRAVDLPYRFVAAASPSISGPRVVRRGLVGRQRPRSSPAARARAEG